MKPLLCYHCGEDLSSIPYKERRIIKCKCGSMNIMSDNVIEALTYFYTKDNSIHIYDEKYRDLNNKETK